MSSHLNIRHITYAIDCPDAPALADFYARLLGWSRELDSDEPDWASVTPPAGEYPNIHLGFQQVDEYHAPTWPEGPIPQQAHLDFYVDSIAESESLAVELGARAHPVQPSEDGGFRVFIDPAGHPFCLCVYS